MNDKAAIENVLGRITEALSIIGPNPQKGFLSKLIEENPALLPEFSEREISIFRHVVRTGAVTDARFRRPNGYKVLGLLILIRELHLRQYLKTLESQNVELVEIMTGTWLANIERAGGDLTKAKEKMKTLWGTSKMDSNTRDIFNQSFLIAKEQWESNTKNATA